MYPTEAVLSRRNREKGRGEKRRKWETVVEWKISRETTQFSYPGQYRFRELKASQFYHFLHSFSLINIMYASREKNSVHSGIFPLFFSLEFS